MSWLDKLEKKWRPFAVPNIAMYCIGGQFLFYAIALTQPEIISRIELVPAKVLEGEVWRLFTFVLTPPGGSAFWAFIAWYVFWLTSSALESKWGTARFNLFLLIGWTMTISVSFLAPQSPASVTFLEGSVFLAFAYLFPNFEFLIFFILPVRVKWLALLAWIGYAMAFLAGGWSTKLLISASLSNYFLFFGRDIFLAIRQGRRRMEAQARNIQAQNEVRHRCATCDMTDQSHPGADFRYCSRCAEPTCYCQDHLRSHKHTVTPTVVTPTVATPTVATPEEAAEAEAEAGS